MHLNHNFWFQVTALLLAFSMVVASGSHSGITNCTENITACQTGCNEPLNLPYSATFCETSSGSCMCDCRDTLATTCMRDPDSDCNLNCENKNPNPDVFTYYGNYCRDGIGNETLVCSCACFLSSDYVETNEI